MILRRLAFAALAALTVSTALTVPAHAATPAPVVFDTDMDFDDAATLAYLCQAHKRHRIELRAVTVVNNGSGTPGRALTHTRTILEKCGLGGIPVADGSDEGVNAPTADARAWTEKILSGALGDGNRPDRPSVLPASLLFAASVLSAPAPVVVVATGPLTNVAKATRLPGVAEKISRISVMGGAFGVPGNVEAPHADGSQETNIWLDPLSAREVFQRSRVDIVPLDATNDVPITPAFVQRIGTSKTPESVMVHGILTQPDIWPFIEQGVGYWWDTLAASAAFDAVSPVEFREDRVDVVVTGESAGRTVVSADGTPQRVGRHGNLAAYEAGYFATLDGS
ncbi:nucleoside hydrolase [Amycolatopsis sp. cg5]|uniref:nucleoside hydrolase n=1 Tax=Amycolatopsis sp. cg5 TaxID=3238802 RepID=UPI003523B572